MTWLDQSYVRGINFHRDAGELTVAKRILLATLVFSLLGSSACVGESLPAGQASGQTVPAECATYADCGAGMICKGASPNTHGVCVWQAERGGGEPKMGYDAPGKGLLGTVYGQPMIRRLPPPGVSPQQAGGTWDIRTGTYYPPEGGGWRYQPGPDHGFNGKWVFDSGLTNPSPGADVIDSTAN